MSIPLSGGATITLDIFSIFSGIISYPSISLYITLSIANVNASSGILFLTIALSFGKPAKFL